MSNRPFCCCWNSSDSKGTFSFYAFIMNNKVLLYLYHDKIISKCTLASTVLFDDWLACFFPAGRKEMLRLTDSVLDAGFMSVPTNHSYYPFYCSMTSLVSWCGELHHWDAPAPTEPRTGTVPSLCMRNASLDPCGELTVHTHSTSSVRPTLTTLPLPNYATPRRFDNSVTDFFSRTYCWTLSEIVGLHCLDLSDGSSHTHTKTHVILNIPITHKIHARTHTTRGGRGATAESEL